MAWPEYDSADGAWGDPATFKPKAQNLDISNAIDAYNVIANARDQQGGVASLAGDGKTKIEQMPVAFFSFWFNPGNGNIIAGVDADGKNISGTLPPGYNFTKDPSGAIYFLGLPGDEYLKNRILVTPASTLQFAVTTHVVLISSQRARIRLITHETGTTGVRTVASPPPTTVGGSTFVAVCGWAAKELCKG